MVAVNRFLRGFGWTLNPLVSYSFSLDFGISASGTGPVDDDTSNWWCFPFLGGNSMCTASKTLSLICHKQNKEQKTHSCKMSRHCSCCCKTLFDDPCRSNCWQKLCRTHTVEDSKEDIEIHKFLCSSKIRCHSKKSSKLSSENNKVGNKAAHLECMPRFAAHEL